MAAIQQLSEIERGRSEASHTQVVKILNLRRYISPPPDTPFPLEYAFHLLGDVSGKTVLDLGCGSGENIIPLLAAGATVIAVDISPDLLAIAKKRVALSDQSDRVTFIEASAYDVPLPSGSVEAILCASLLHHLEIPAAMKEMRRLLKTECVVVVKEPVRFSKTFGWLRSFFPEQQDVSEDEHPLTPEEFASIKHGWKPSGERAFRLPIIPLAEKLLSPNMAFKTWKLDGWLLQFLPCGHFATSRVLKLTP